MYQVNFVLQKVRHAVAGGTLAEACAAAGYPLNLVCGGRGTCGKCKVRIEAEGLPQWVLACTTPVDRDFSVFLTEADLTRSAAIATEGVSHQVHRLNPMVSRRLFTRNELTPDHCGAWLKAAPLEVMARFSLLAADRSVDTMTFTYYGQELIDVAAGDQSAALYGGAVDIGTTSVVLYVYDLCTGALLTTQSELNGQISWGADVISRIQHAIDDPQGAAQLTAAIRATVEGLLRRGEEVVPGLREHLYHMVFCGNSTMQQLFLGLHPGGLACDPFVNVTADPVHATGAQLGLTMAPGGRVDFLPLLGGFVGADTASVLLTLPQEGRRLMIDLGTNGEIALCDAQGYHVASTACGPALEGGSITCGMRGTDGAIERISLSEDTVALRIISGGKVVGLCGSAIIDAVAELYRMGLMDDTGRLLSRDEFLSAHPGSPLGLHLFQAGPYNPAFRFAEDVYLTQADIRQIQLAKSAICAGCLALLHQRGIALEDLDAICLAGAFGSYIDIDRALEIGLLPPVARERIASVGNGAGKGVQLCLLDRAQLERCADLPHRAIHIELASSPVFMEEYMLRMNFGGTV